MKIIMKENLDTSCRNQEVNEITHNNEHNVRITKKGPYKKQHPGYRRSPVNKIKLNTNRKQIQTQKLKQNTEQK